MAVCTASTKKTAGGRENHSTAAAGPFLSIAASYTIILLFPAHLLLVRFLPGPAPSSSKAMVRGSAGQGPADHYSHVWDPLQGAGPSSSERYYDNLNPQNPNFPSKPGWKSLRHQADIKQDHERLQAETIKVARKDAQLETARGVALERHLTHGFNPITGREYNKSTASWQQASDPWAHQRVASRPAHVIHAAEAQASGTMRGGQARIDALAPVVEMRKERIANGGLSAQQRKHGGVKELMQWNT